MVHKQLYYEIYYNFLSIVNDDNDDVNTKYKNAKLSSLIRLYLFQPNAGRISNINIGDYNWTDTYFSTFRQTRQYHASG